MQLNTRVVSLFGAVSLLALAQTSSAAQAAPKVVASIVPVHALVAGVMEGVGTPELLLSGQTSEHQASYSPAQLKSLADADLTFIIGQGLELKLDELSGSEAVKGKRFVELSDLPGLTKLPIREGGAFAPHDHEHAHGESKAEDAEHDHDHEGETHAEGEERDHDHGKASFDPHIWLDPVNAKVMVAAIAENLSKADPDNTAAYDRNAKAFTQEMDELAADLAQDLAGLKDKPFVVQHDAYQYFEARFGLTVAGSIADLSANDPSAQRLKEVRDKLKAVNAVCVFREPQFSDRAAQTVIEGTSARSGVLDPIGASLPPGKGTYAQLLRNLAAELRSCLAG